MWASQCFACATPDCVAMQYANLRVGRQVTAYAVESVQQRGRLFVEPGQEIYEDQVVGIHQRQGDPQGTPPRHPCACVAVCVSGFCAEA